MILIIRDQLVNPPTWFSSFRDLTLYCHVFLHDEVVIESENPDPYYRWIKPRGGMDFVEDFVRPGTENGVHLDLEPNYHLAKGDVMFAATGVTKGYLLDGVRFFGDGARTESIVMRSKSGTVRVINATHHFNTKPKYSWATGLEP